MKPVLIEEEGLRSIWMKDYVVEPKFDGWRAVLTVNGRPRLWTRQRRPIEIPKGLQEEIESLNLKKGTVLDGEIWNPAKRGGWTDPEGEGCRLTLWDCVRDGFENLGRAPLEERRERLEAAVREPRGSVRLTEPVDASLEAVASLRREASRIRKSEDVRSGFIHGAVLKRRKSRRGDHPTRSVEDAAWLKVVFDGMKGWEPPPQ